MATLVCGVKPTRQGPCRHVQVGERSMVGFECVSYRSGWAHSLGQDRTLSMKCIGKGPYGRDSHMGSAQALRLVGRLCGLILLLRERHVAETRCPEMRVFWCWQGDSHSESGPVPARRMPRWATSHREAEASRSKSLEVSHSKSWPRQSPTKTPYASANGVSHGHMSDFRWPSSEGHPFAK